MLTRSEHEDKVLIFVQGSQREYMEIKARCGQLSREDVVKALMWAIVCQDEENIWGVCGGNVYFLPTHCLHSLCPTKTNQHPNFKHISDTFLELSGQDKRTKGKF